jgi:hypothetical protein
MDGSVIDATVTALRIKYASPIFYIADRKTIKREHFAQAMILERPGKGLEKEQILTGQRINLLYSLLFSIIGDCLYEEIHKAVQESARLP